MQVVEHLLCKCSNPRTTKRKKMSSPAKSKESFLALLFNSGTFFFLVLLGFWRASRSSTAGITPPSSFCSGYFRDKGLLFAQASLDHNPSILHFLPGMRAVYHHAHLFSVEMRFYEFLCLDWPGTANPHLSAFCVDRMIAHTPHWAVVGLMNFLPGLALNCDPPDLSLPSS
jgi:hypothetical protein